MVNRRATDALIGRLEESDLIPLRSRRILISPTENPRYFKLANPWITLKLRVAGI